MIQSKYRGVIAVINREWRRMLGRPIYLFSSVFVMLFCYIFFLTFFQEGLPRAMPIGVVDMDHSYVSRTFTRNIDAIPQTEIVASYSDYAKARQAMQQGEIYAFFVIDKNFEKDLMSSRQPEFNFYVNDAYLVAGSLTYKELTYISNLGSAFVQKSMMELKGTVDENEILAIVQPVAIDAHLLANPYSNYAVYLLNMLLPGIMQMLVLLMTVFTIGYELKMKTIPDLLKTANNSMFAALMGKMLPYTILFTILGIGGNFILYKYMHFPMHGNFWHMSLATILYVIAYQAAGIFAIGLLPVLREALSLVAVYGILGVSFTGFTFPIEAMPRGVQVFQHLFPIRHYFKIYVNEALNGAPLRYSLIYYAAIISFFILPFFMYKRLKNAALNSTPSIEQE